MVHRLVKSVRYTNKTLIDKAKLSFASKAGYLLDKNYKSDVDKAVKEYLSHFNCDSVDKLRNDMIKANIVYGYTFDQYIGFDYYHRTKSERKDYMGQKERQELFSKYPSNTLPRDKFERYSIFKDFFRRDVIRIDFNNNTEESELYNEFISKHDEFIVKPMNGTKGKGIEKLFSADFPNLEALKKECGGAVMLEDLIIQGEELAEFHPSSINSCRFVSVINKSGEVSPLFATIRTGRGGSVVDNVGAGGITALVDITTGTVCTDGVCGFEYFEKHPDTGKLFKGFRLPNWDELCKLASDAHRVRPQQKMFGWDFAWTDKGYWDIIEVNPSPAFISYQKLAGKGIRPQVLRLGLIDKE